MNNNINHNIINDIEISNDYFNLLNKNILYVSNYLLSI